jgi:hypothetical protein
MHRGRAEVPQDGIAVAGEQSPTAELVALPLADFGRGDIADVVDVEDQQRAQLGLLERLFDAAQPVAMKPAIIDPFLEVDAHDAERWQGTPPVIAGIDVVGADLADRVVHGDLLRMSGWPGGPGLGVAGL